MNKCSKISICILLTAVLCNGIIAQENRPIITVLDFKGSNIAEAEIFVFVDYITSLVVESGLFRVIDRSQRETLLQEIEFSLSGCTDEACQLEIGRLLSAKFIIIGSLGTVGTRYILNMKMIDIETSETIASASERYTSMDDLIDDSDRLVAIFVGAEEEDERPGTIAKEEDSNIRSAEVEGKKVELVPSPVPRTQQIEKRNRHGVEAAMGYMDGPVVTFYGGYTYEAFKLLGFGAFAGFFVADQEYYDDYYDYYYTETVTDFMWGLKVYFGKRDGFAFAVGSAFLPEYSLPFIGAYFSNVFVDIAIDPESEAVYFDAGYAMSF